MVAKHQAKSQPLAGRLRRHKGLEQARENLWRDAGAAIADDDLAFVASPIA